MTDQVAYITSAAQVAAQAAAANAAYRAANNLPPDPTNTAILARAASIQYLNQQDAANEAAMHAAAFAQPRSDVRVAPQEALEAYARQQQNTIGSGGAYRQGSFQPTVETGGPITGRAALQNQGAPLQPSSFYTPLQPERTVTEPIRDLSSNAPTRAEYLGYNQYDIQALAEAPLRPGFTPLSTLGDSRTALAVRGVDILRSMGFNVASEDVITGRTLEAQRQAAFKTPGLTDDRFFSNALQQWVENKIELSSTYHHIGMRAGIPIPANRFEYQGDLAVELLKGEPRKDSERFSPVSGEMSQYLPKYQGRGEGIQDYAWRLAERGTGAGQVSFGAGIEKLLSAEGKYGPYGILFGGPDYKTTPSGQVKGSTVAITPTSPIGVEIGIREGSIPRPFMSGVPAQSLLNLPGPGEMTITSIEKTGTVAQTRAEPEPYRFGPSSSGNILDVIGFGMLAAGTTMATGTETFFSDVQSRIPSGPLSPLKAGLGFVEAIPQTVAMVPLIGGAAYVFGRDPVWGVSQIAPVGAAMVTGAVTRATTQPERTFGNILGMVALPGAAEAAAGKVATRSPLSFNIGTPIRSGVEGEFNYVSTIGYRTPFTSEIPVVKAYTIMGTDVQGIKFGFGPPTTAMRELTVTADPMFIVRDLSGAHVMSESQRVILDPFFRSVSKGTPEEPLVSAMFDIKANIGANVRGGSESILKYENVQPAGTLTQTGISPAVQTNVHEILAEAGAIRLGSAAQTDWLGPRFMRSTLESDIDVDFPTSTFGSGTTKLKTAYSKNIQPIEFKGGGEFSFASNPTEHIISASKIESHPDVRYLETKTITGKTIYQQTPEYGIESKASRTLKDRLTYSPESGIDVKFTGKKVEKDIADIYAASRGIARTAYEQNQFTLGQTYEGISTNLRLYAESKGMAGTIRTIPEDILRTPEAIAAKARAESLYQRTIAPRGGMFDEEAILMPGKRAGIDFTVEKTPRFSDWKYGGMETVRDIVGKENTFYHATDITTVERLQTTGTMRINSEGKGEWGTGHLHFAGPGTLDPQFLGPQGGVIKIIETPTYGNKLNRVAAAFEYEKPGALRAIGKPGESAREFVIPKGTQIDYLRTTYLENPQLPEDWLPVAEVKISKSPGGIKRATTGGTNLPDLSTVETGYPMAYTVEPAARSGAGYPISIGTGIAIVRANTILPEYPEAISSSLTKSPESLYPVATGTTKAPSWTATDLPYPPATKPGRGGGDQYPAPITPGGGEHYPIGGGGGGDQYPTPIPPGGGDHYPIGGGGDGGKYTGGGGGGYEGGGGGTGRGGGGGGKGGGGGGGGDLIITLPQDLPPEWQRSRRRRRPARFVELFSFEMGIDTPIPERFGRGGVNRKALEANPGAAFIEGTRGYAGSILSTSDTAPNRLFDITGTGPNRPWKNKQKNIIRDRL